MFNVANMVPGKTILTYNVGCTMSLPHFCIVEGITPSGKSIRVRHMTEKFECTDGGYGFQGFKTPGEPYGEVITVRIGKYGPKMRNHLLFEWNGEPQYYDSLD